MASNGTVPVSTSCTSNNIPKKKQKPSVRWGEYIETVPTIEEDDEATKAIIQEILKKSLIPEHSQDKTQDVSHNLNLPENLIQSRMDSKVLHQLQLDHYLCTVTDMIDKVTKSDPSETTKLFSAPPAIPQNPNLQPKKSHGFLSQNGRQQDSTDFSIGLAKPKIDVSLNIAKQLLYKSVGTLLCHSKYEESDRSALDVFTDVVDQLLSSICSRLRVAVDQEVMSGESGFHDVVERVFTEMNLGSIEELLAYYQESIVEPNLVTLQKCEALSRSYLALVKSKVDVMNETDQEEEIYLGSDDRGEEVEDEEDDDEDVPEIHFPALDEEDQLGLQPSLEPGFQMLDSLEHDETLQNLDPDEEINVSDSPSQEFMLSVISELSNTQNMQEAAKAKKKKPRK